MALYLGSNKKSKVKLANNSYHLYAGMPIVETIGIKLLSSDNNMLKDINGLQLITKENK